jgi:uncharacterized protein YjbI with pentapeptide repeats
VPYSTHTEILRLGAAEWNEWRSAHPDDSPSLAGADLKELDLADADLHGANLSDADLTGADLYGADLRSANLKMANLIGVDLTNARVGAADLLKACLRDAFLHEADLGGADLNGADLKGADLRAANLTGADLSGADLRDCRLDKTDLTDADLSGADITGARMGQANLAGANVFDLKYGTFRSMRHHYYGIRGLSTCYGNRIFVRDAADRDYLGTLEKRISADPSPPRRMLRKAGLWGWGLIDYGRSLGRLTAAALLVALAFGTVYALDRSFDWGLLDHAGGEETSFSPFYFSIVTYTTLGFGDITPASLSGEIIVVIEVVLGYITLGMLLAILANRVARRA